jgi:hypothetical protein
MWLKPIGYRRATDPGTAWELDQPEVFGVHPTVVEKPYTVSVPEKDYWLVSGSGPKGQFRGTFAVWIKKQSGCIVNISYTK